MKKWFAILLLIGIKIGAEAQDLNAFLIYKSDSTLTTFDSFIEAASVSDVVLFGEEHNNPVAHWVELKTLELLYSKVPNLALGMEMFETDNQLIINEYLEGLYPIKKLKAEAKLWDNFNTDYQPLTEFCKDNGVPLIATNVPRRYASLVYKKGVSKLEHLTKEALNYLPPLPFAYDSNLTCYAEISKYAGHSNPNLSKSQALKDASMAYQIINRSAKYQVLHFNGNYHSDNYEGIYWYLKQYDENLNILTLSTVSVVDIEDLSQIDFNKADYLLVVPSDMTKTY
jgi:uncharacterized iron-regulated protein